MRYIIKNIKQYLYLFFPLFIVFFMFSIIEIFLAIGDYDISFLEFYFFKATNDFWTVLGIVLFLFPLYLLTGLVSERFQKIVFLILFVFLLIAQFMLVKYAIETLVNLGADILGYSLEEIIFIIKASKETSLIEIVPIVFLLMLFFDMYSFIRKRIEIKVLLVLFIALCIYHGVGYIYFKEIKDEKYQNKMNYFITDISVFKMNEYKMKSLKFDNRHDYPFVLESNKFKDELSPFFNLKTNKKPNFVVIIVEGLGTEFLGSKYHSGFMPYLDSLIDKSLYWENFLANTGRTFGVLPSLIGSLPMGQKGFLENKTLPDHKSLFNLLRYNGYQTSYFSGDRLSFDKKERFLRYNRVDVIIDEDLYGREYEKTPANEGGFSWGYPDKEIFKKSLQTLGLSKNTKPRFDVIMTLSNHEPFNFPNKKMYDIKVDSIFSKNNLTITKDDVETYKNIFSTLLYTDESIAYFIKEYEKREDYENTIFIITGDHRLIPINQKDKLCRFHVPLFITSPMLKKSKSFKAISSHWDVAPSIASLLKNKYGLEKSDRFSWLGKGLDTFPKFRNRNKIPLMRYKGNINDFVYQDYLLSDKVVYKIKENFGIYKIENDSINGLLEGMLNEFKMLNRYVSTENRIIAPGMRIYSSKMNKLKKEDSKRILEETRNMSFDEVFFAARDSAFSKKYKKALLLCDYVLDEYPSYLDAQILKGRVYAWNGAYEYAEENLLEVLVKSPYYDDTYLALLDLYWWSNQDVKSIELVKKAKINNILNPDVSFKLVKAYQRMGNVLKATSEIDSLIQKHPDSLKYVNYKNILK